MWDEHYTERRKVLARAEKVLALLDAQDYGTTDDCDLRPQIIRATREFDDAVCELAAELST